MIRKVEEKDIEECVAVIRESFGTVAEEFGFTRENAPRFTAFATTTQRLASQFQEKRPMYVYEKTLSKNIPVIIGYYSLQIQENGECELNNLCVLPQYRHQKVGEALFHHAVLQAAEAGCIKINIGIVEENKRLRAWYEKLGAKHIGIKKFDFFPFTCGYMEHLIYLKELYVDMHDYIEGGTIFRRKAARGIVQRNGKYLMVHGNKVDYQFPGGGMEQGETLIDTLCREVQEETGYRVIPECVRDIMLVHEKRKGMIDDIFEMDSWYFFCDVEETTVECHLDNHEIEEDYHVVWMTLEEAIEKNEKNNSPWILRENMAMKEVLQRRSGKDFYDTTVLKNDEIQLVLEKITAADASKDWLAAYHFHICSLSGTIMGKCDLRIGHNEKVYYGGNIGYNILPEYRGNHYAGKACRLLFKLAKKYHMEYLIITCNPDNYASRKTCEYAGGKLIEIVELPADNDMRQDGETHKCIYRFDI